MPTPTNAALIIAGPALVQRRGRSFYSKGNVTVRPVLTRFAIDTARFAKIEDREDLISLEVKLTPAGQIAANVLSELWPYGSIVPGRFVHAVSTIASINTTSNVVTVDVDLEDGAAVRIATFGALPGGTAAATLYFWHRLSATTGTLHPTRADAIANANIIDITSAGTGTHKLIEQEPLVIHGYDGTKYTFHNSALTGVPDLNTAANKTAIGEVTFECFRQHGLAPTDAAAMYTTSTAAVSDTSFDPATILTEAYQLVWGATAPWSDMSTKDGATIRFPMSLDPITDDAGGLLTRKITSLGISVTARPNNVDGTDVLAKRVMQSTGAGRGRRIVSSDHLNVIGSGLYVRAYGAALLESPLNWDNREDRIAPLVWEGTRTFASGAPNPVYFVGTAAPS